MPFTAFVGDIPDQSGQTQTNAVATLAALGPPPPTVVLKFASSSSVPSGTVISHVDTPTALGTTVTLTISTGSGIAPARRAHFYTTQISARDRR